MKFKLPQALLCIILMLNMINAQQKEFWAIQSNTEINLDVTNEDNLPYEDNIEMAGKLVAGIVSYKIDENKKLSISREIFFPQLRTFIKTNDPEWKHYRAYFKDVYNDDILPDIIINDKIYVPGDVEKVIINGKLQFKHAPVHGIALTRTFYPSMSQRIFIEEWKLTNLSEKSITLLGNNNYRKKTSKGVKGKYSAISTSNIKNSFTINQGASYSFSIGISATLNEEKEIDVTSNEFLNERNNYLAQIKNSLTLVTPNKTLNTLFEFSKIRASESIFESKLGLIHSPGGGRYYVGFWANDQAEYVNPFFPYLGYETGNKAAINMYDLYTKEITDDYKNIRYSFEMEGDAPINTLDRGDAAMIAYGALQYALTSGSGTTAKKLWPLISWCLEYNNRNLNNFGVVSSESDEMEGRIETGNANLSTSSLYYGALNLAIDLAKSLKKPEDDIQKYKDQAQKLFLAIESYFGSNIEGLDTYKYYKEHNQLRHWICLPLVVGIFNRSEETTKALFENLWTKNGVHVEKNHPKKSNSEIFWDRGTLYALRGTYLAGAKELSTQKLIEFSTIRLLGNRVPYVVEAYPEGSMAHLSAESGLYCRVFTEGMFGIIPTGLDSFKCTPRLPKNWNHMALENIKAFDSNFNIHVTRKGKKLQVKITNENSKLIFNKHIQNGDTINVVLK